ncbi:MAG: YfhO family protein [Clostridia bacterium]|nr:YfhO family protein [Clostridia bacterium]
MYGNNVMWLDALLLFPLVIYGADLVISGKGYLPYTLFVALTLLSHYYMGFMVCIFLVLYFFYHHIVHSGSDRYNPKGERVHFLLSGLRYLFFTLLAVGISAVVLSTAAYSLTFGKDTFTDPVYEFTFKLNFLDIIYKLLPGAADTVRREGLPFLYCGTATLFGAAVFAISPRFKTREKVGAGLMLLILTLCFSVSVIDIWWHGGQEPNWLNYRYSYMFSFILLVIGYRGFDKIRQVSGQFLAVVPAVLGIFLVMLQQEGYGQDYEYTKEIFPKSYNYDLLFYFFAPIVIGAVFLAILYYKKKRGKRAGVIALTATILAETVVVGLVSQIALACDVGYSGRSSYTDFINRVEPAVEYVQKLDDGFYRMDKTFHRQPADAMAFEMRSLSSTTSTLNRHTLKVLRQLGFASGTYWSEYRGATPVTDMLLGVKYVLTEDTCLEGLYERIYTDDKGEVVYVYKNPYALSLGYAVNDAVLSMDFDDYATPMELLNDLCALMTGVESNRPFLPLEVGAPTLEKVTTSYTAEGDHTIYKKGADVTDASITYTLTADETGLHYLYLPTEYPRECMLYIDGVEQELVLANNVTHIIPLGNFEKGSSHQIKLVPQKEKTYVMDHDVYFWSFDEKILQSCHEALSNSQFVIDEDFTEEHLTGKITVKEDKTLFFTSVPYDKGWILTVDGKEVEAYTAPAVLFDDESGEQIGTEEQPFQDALIVLELGEGVHEISLRYRPDAFVYGGVISLLSCLLLVVIVLVDKLLLQPYKAQKEYKQLMARIAAISIPDDAAGDPPSPSNDDEGPNTGEHRDENTKTPLSDK